MLKDWARVEDLEVRMQSTINDLKQSKAHINTLNTTDSELAIKINALDRWKNQIELKIEDVETMSLAAQAAAETAAQATAVAAGVASCRRSASAGSLLACTGTEVQILMQLLRSLLQVPQVLQVLQGQDPRAEPPPQPARPALEHCSMRLEFLQQRRSRWYFVALSYHQQARTFCTSKLGCDNRMRPQLY